MAVTEQLTNALNRSNKTVGVVLRDLEIWNMVHTQSDTLITKNLLLVLNFPPPPIQAHQSSI